MSDIVNLVEASKRLRMTLPQLAHYSSHDRSFPPRLDLNTPQRLYDWDQLKLWNDRRLYGGETRAQYHRNRLAEFDRLLAS